MFCAIAQIFAGSPLAHRLALIMYVLAYQIYNAYNASTLFEGCVFSIFFISGRSMLPISFVKAATRKCPRCAVQITSFGASLHFTSSSKHRLLILQSFGTPSEYLHCVGKPTQKCGIFNVGAAVRTFRIGQTTSTHIHCNRFIHFLS